MASILLTGGPDDAAVARMTPMVFSRARKYDGAKRKQLTVAIAREDPPNPSVDGDFYYLPVMKEMDVYMIKEGVLPSSLRADGIHPSTEGKSLLNAIIEKVLEVKNI